MSSQDPQSLAFLPLPESEPRESHEHGEASALVCIELAETGNFMSARSRRAPVFTRKNIGGEPQKCEKCGSDKVFFVQHSHGNYPILDYVCPKCDLGGDQGIPDWYSSPTGKQDSPEE